MNLMLIGLLSGIIGGMGIGGGTILIPALIMFTTLSQQQAQSVNLLSFVPVAIVALITHFRNKSIEIKLCLPLIAMGIVGALAGSYLAVNLPSNLLRKLFGVFLFFMGIYEFFWKDKSRTK
jgi:uncharacterized membrane protein YfcA